MIYNHLYIAIYYILFIDKLSVIDGKDGKHGHGNFYMVNSYLMGSSLDKLSVIWSMII